MAIDSAPLIYFLDGAPGRAELVRDLLDAAVDGRVELVTSTINEAEVLVGPLRAGNRAGADDARALFASDRLLTVVPADREIAASAADIRASTGLGLPDAFLVGAARAHGCTLIVGNDAAFTRLDDVAYVHLDDHV